MENRIIVFTAGFNSAKWVKKNVNSIKKQDYDNYIHVVVDDATTDQTKDILEKHKHDKLYVHRNKKNQKWIYNSITHLPQHIKSEEDIIVVVDLDDWLSGPDTLKTINRVYNERSVWMTYGSFVSASRKGTRTSKPRLKHYTQHTMETKEYRQIPWKWWHPRTFKAFLWMNIRRDDMKGPNGQWAPYTYDTAIGFPMLEMCPPNKIGWIKDVLYIYNRANPLASSKHKKRGGGYGGHFRQIAPYKTLER